MSSVFGDLKIKGFSESFENYFWGLKGLRKINGIDWAKIKMAGLLSQSGHSLIREIANFRHSKLQ